MKRKKTKAAKTTSNVKSSSKADFIESLKTNNSMVDYMSRLSVMNPAAKMEKDFNKPQREGAFVRLAHARHEFTAPVLSKGKAKNRELAEAKLKKKNKES